MIARVGNGQNTTYQFDRLSDECEKVTRKEIENLLPEKLREVYDGTIESLYKIVQMQVMMYLPGGEDAHDSDEDGEEYDDEEERKREKKRRSNLVSYDDEDEDDEDDEEEEDEPPRRRKAATPKLPKAKVSSCKKKGSVKSFFRK